MTATNNGIIEKPSNHSVDQTVEKLKQILQSKEVALFALVDHSGEAEKVGMKMPPTKLLIFGNPAAGTPLMLAAPSCAIDLPLKILVWEDKQGKVWVSYNSPEYLGAGPALSRVSHHGTGCPSLRGVRRLGIPAADVNRFSSPGSPLSGSRRKMLTGRP